MIDIKTLIEKEIKRYLQVWKQTLLPPVITIVLYLLIFWKFLWEQISLESWINYIDFLFPWLLMMSVISASYANTSFSFFTSKMFNNIEELLVSPMSHSKILFWYCIAWISRWFIVWLLVYLVSLFFIDINIYNYFYFSIFIILTSLLFSLLWMINWIFAKSFDDVNIIPTFVITPLTYLWWVFYSIDILSPFWQLISQFNPILYMVNWLRYSFIWISDVNILYSMFIILIFIIIFIFLNLYLLKKGSQIKN